MTNGGGECIMMKMEKLENKRNGMGILGGKFRLKKYLNDS